MGSCWYIFQLGSSKVDAEALERLLWQRYVYNMRGTSIQTIFEQVQVDPDLEMSQDLFKNVENAKLLYQTYQENIKNCLLGKKAQFWITYINLVKMQHTIYTAFQENDFEMWLFRWEYFLSLYFVLNKVNYWKYGTYYVS